MRGVPEPRQGLVMDEHLPLLSSLYVAFAEEKFLGSTLDVIFDPDDTSTLVRFYTKIRQLLRGALGLFAAAIDKEDGGEAKETAQHALKLLRELPPLDKHGDATAYERRKRRFDLHAMELELEDEDGCMLAFDTLRSCNLVGGGGGGAAGHDVAQGGPRYDLRQPPPSAPPCLRTIRE